MWNHSIIHEVYAIPCTCSQLSRWFFYFPLFTPAEGYQPAHWCQWRSVVKSNMYCLDIWSWNSQDSLLEVFSCWGVFSLETELFELGLKICLSFFQKANPNPFPLPLFFQTWAFHVSDHLLIHSLSPWQLALLAAVLCPVAAGYAFHVKLRLSVTLALRALFFC